MWRIVYTTGLWIALPVVLARLWWRGRKERGYRTAIGQRFGFYGRRQPGAVRPLIWIHAVSLGETRAVRPLFALLCERYPGHDFLVTHMTATGRQAARELFGGRASFAWLPYDYGFAVKRFLERFRPDLGILVETEVWFNLVRTCARAGVPLLLANARLSEKSARGYEKLLPLSREAFSALSAVAAQSDADARRLQRLGARNVSVTGNMKFDAGADPALDALAAEFRRGYGDRRVFLAASTREGEEDLLLRALGAGLLPGALVVIVPRHPQRFAEVEALIASQGFAYVRRSLGTRVPDGCRVVLGDSLGELHAYYAAADVAFVGGSLLDYGGQNLIEACAAGVPVLLGPHTHNFADAARAALEEGAARMARDAASLLRMAASLLEDEAARRSMGEAGRALCTRHRGATAKIAALAESLARGPR
jgi:3-deoxy-D-manno-octulosonic-acid transferase